MTLDKSTQIVLAIIGIIGAIWAIGALYYGLDDRIGDMEANLARHIESNDDSQCLEIVRRQVSAASQGTDALRTRLNRLADRYSCGERTDAALAYNMAANMAASNVAFTSDNQ